MEKVSEKRSNRARPFVVQESDIGYQRMAAESESGNLYPIYTLAHFLPGYKRK